MGRKTTIWIILATVLSCAVMALVDGVLHPGYGVKTVVKLTLFLFVPFTLAVVDRAVSIRGLFRSGRKGLMTALILGFALYGLILGAYFVADLFWDFSAIARQLSTTQGVSAENFLYVAIYISVFNSLLEEFFFRGFLFTNLKRSASRPLAYGFSAGMFALYHAAMMIGWFHPVVYVLVIGALAAAGVLFNWFHEKFGTLYVPWFVHMFANLAINTIGFLLLTLGDL